MQGGAHLDARLDLSDDSRAGPALRREGARNREEIVQRLPEALRFESRRRKKLIAGRRVRIPNATSNPTELAAMTMLANQVLNLDEVLNK